MEASLFIAAAILFLAILGAFALMRRINRFMIFLLAASFVLFCLSMGSVAIDSYVSGVAPWRSSWGSAQVAREANPIAYWISAGGLGLWSLVCGFMGLWLARIALMRRQHGP